jgi:alpha-L-rhamnosidase
VPVTPRESPVVERLRAEYRTGPALGIGESAPRLSWCTSTSIPDWVQSAYEIEIDGSALGRVEGHDSVYVAWPGSPLGSREPQQVRVRVWGEDGSSSPWSEPLTVEAGLLRPTDWSASWITNPDADDIRPQRFRHEFSSQREVVRARLYVTSAGIHEVVLNGKVVGENLLAPGWTAYGSRLRYDTHDVTALIRSGDNVLGAVVADGWYRGHLTWDMKRNVYGDRLGLLAQLEISYADGATHTISTDSSWRCASGPWGAADLYNGESYDARAADEGWSQAAYDDRAWPGAVVFAPPVGELVVPIGPPVRRTQELPVVEVLTSPTGKTLLDFGQNMVGWVRFSVDGEAGTTVTLRHAEVLELGELGTRPLRGAQATDRYTLRGGGPETWEPRFTFHGFRYVEVDGWPGKLDPAAFSGVVIHSDIEQTGAFSCSHELLNQLHRNVTWSMRGNFVDVPTDCPQRDERLGWTGDIQVFAPTATFLYDVGGFLADWLEDLLANQGADGAVPMVIPTEPIGPGTPGGFFAAWGDAATVVPWTLYERYGDTDRLARQLASMQRWVDFIASRTGDSLLWPAGFQFGDWLDPAAPPDEPYLAKTDPMLVGTAYFARSAQITSEAARVLGHTETADRYAELASQVRQAFRDQYVAPSGRISSDAPTAYALALAFDLYEKPEQRAHAVDRLAELSEAGKYRIATGFVGTPLVLPVLSAAGDTRTAYRLMTETACPSWLYPVTMGATTVWERWDSMLPDGSINGGEMTSFNHYALGGVAEWMHQVIGGLAPAAPGSRRLRIAPVPGRGVTSAECSLRTPYGLAACRWALDGTQVELEVDVPPNSFAVVIPPGTGEVHEIGSGTHRWVYAVADTVVDDWMDAPVEVAPTPWF